MVSPACNFERQQRGRALNTTVSQGSQADFDSATWGKCPHDLALLPLLWNDGVDKRLWLTAFVITACGPPREVRKRKSWYFPRGSDWADVLSSGTVQRSKLGFQCMAGSIELCRKTLA